MDRSGDLQKRIQQKIREQIQKLKDAQSDRAEVIEAALKDFETSKFFKKRIRTIADYIALAQMQRRMLGLADSKMDVSVSGEIDFTERLVNAKKRAEEKLVRKKNTRK